MNQLNNLLRPYALKEGEGWTYRFGIDFTVKAREVQEGNGAAIFEYVTRRNRRSHLH
jgi:hypothetical protein